MYTILKIRNQIGFFEKKDVFYRFDIFMLKTEK